MTNTDHVTKQDLKLEITAVRKDVAELRQSTKQDLHQEISGVKQDIAELRQATKQDLHQAIAEVSKDLGGQIAELADMTARQFEELKKEIRANHEDIKQLLVKYDKRFDNHSVRIEKLEIAVG